MAQARQAPLTERRYRAPAFDWRRALTLLLYPLQLFCPRRAGSIFPWSTSQARLQAMVIQTEAELSPAPRTEGCAVCGRLSRAPVHATYLPSGKIVNQWLCAGCRHAWQTSTGSARSATDWPGWSGLLREKAALCMTREDGAPDETARTNFRRMGDGWLALAETQDWLDGRMSPVSRKLPLGGTAGVVTTSISQGHISWPRSATS